MTPDTWQETLLRSSSDRILVLASRQVGKSQTSAALALKTALLSEALVLLVAPSLRQSAELLLKVLTLNRDIGRPIPMARPRDNSLRLDLANGSRILAIPGSEATVRGFSAVSLIVIDEAARVEDSLIAAVRPMLAVSNGTLICVSSAYAKMGCFYEEYTGSNRWERYMIKATECPRISPQFLEEERATMGDLFFRREYDCEFSEATDAVFRDVDIQAMLSDDIEPFFVGG
jgi:hypothetical protein